MPSTNKYASIETRTNGSQYFKIVFPFNYADLEKVRSLPERNFHGSGPLKYWTAPVNDATSSLLRQWGFEMDGNVKPEEAPIVVADLQEAIVVGSSRELYKYQKQGVTFLDLKNGRALIADDMGLGKTAQALSWLQKHRDAIPVIIVVPAFLKLNWTREAMVWMNKPKTQILSGKKVDTKLTGEIIVINYDILNDWVDTLKAINPKVLIMDECHYIKNNSAKRTKAIKKLAKGIPHVIGLSGTPIENRPVEIYNAVNLIDYNLFPSFFKFAHRFCGAKNNGFGWNFNGATNTEELHKILTSTVMLRRKKIDVLTDLPPKTFSYVPMELDNFNDYTRAENDFIYYLKTTKGQAAAERASNAATLAEIEGLKQLAVQGKLQQAIAWIRDFLDTSDEKLVVFGVHKFVLNGLMEEFRYEAVKVDGSQTPQQKQNSVDYFQNDKNIRLFIGNIKAAGVGITLTAASNVVFLELPWTPGALAQAADRVHRIGQKESVMIWLLLAANTIEEKIAKLLDSKLKVLDAILDGKETDSSNLIAELMAQYSAD